MKTYFLSFRYYYDKNIILKTAGKRYVYRFVCDLQGLLGYSPEEIHHMVDLKLENAKAKAAANDILKTADFGQERKKDADEKIPVNTCTILPRDLKLKFL